MKAQEEINATFEAEISVDLKDLREMIKWLRAQEWGD